MSRLDTGRCCWTPQCDKDFASNIAFEATDDFGLAHSLAGATEHVCLGPAIMTKPDHNDAIESRIGLTVANAVQPMSVGLAGGSRYRVHSHSAAKAALEWRRSGLLRAVIRSVAAVSGLMPKTLIRAGAAVRVSRSNSDSNSWISLLSRQ